MLKKQFVLLFKSSLVCFSRWCLCKITLTIIYFFTVSQYHYAQLETKYLHCVISLIVLSNVSGFVLDDCCSALFNLFDGYQPVCVFLKKRILTKGS